MIRFDDPHATRLLIQHARTTYMVGVDWSVARYDARDRLMGGIIVNNYTGEGGSAQLHVASFQPRWGSRSLLYLAFNYPFRELKVRRLIGLVPESNWRARNLDLHLGFKMEMLIPDVYPWEPSGCWVMGMYASDCRWLDMSIPHIQFAPIEHPLMHMPTVGVA